MGTPVMGGGGDQPAAAVGTGVVSEGIVSLSLGTSGVVFASADQPIVEPEGRLHAFCHAVPGKWHLMGVMLSAAGGLRWYRDALAPKTGFDTLVQPAASVGPGSDSLLSPPPHRRTHPTSRSAGAGYLRRVDHKDVLTQNAS